MSDPTSATLRRTMKAITEIAPDSPSIESITVGPSMARQPVGWRGPAIAAVGAFAVIVTIGAVALGATWLRSSNPNLGSASAGPAAEGWVVAASLAADNDSYPHELLALLESQPGAVAVRYVSKEEALAEAIALFADDDYVVSSIRRSADAIPASVRVLANSHRRSQEIASTAAEARGVVTTGLYYGSLGAYGLSAEDILGSYGPSNPTPGDHEAFLTEPSVRGTIVVFVDHDLDSDELDAFTTVAGYGQSRAGGATTRSTLLAKAREHFKEDDEALTLLNDYPEIIEAIFWGSTLDNSTDRQNVAVEFSRLEGVSAVHTGSGVFPVQERELPADAARLRSWWRSRMQREIGLECCNTKSVTNPELRSFLKTLKPAEREAASLEQWRLIAQDACASAQDSDITSITARLRLAACPELVAWRLHPADASTGAITIEAAHTPQQSPLIRSATIRNGTAEVVDMSGWLLVSRGNERNGFIFGQEAQLVPDGSASLFQWGETPQNCPESTPTRIYVCHDPFKAPTGLVLTNWPVQLFDTEGTLIAEWRPTP